MNVLVRLSTTFCAMPQLLTFKVCCRVLRVITSSKYIQDRTAA